MAGPLRVGLIGSGFIAHFHLRSMVGVRNVEIRGVTSPTRGHREGAAQAANDLGLGPARAFDTVAAMLGSGDIDASGS